MRNCHTLHTFECWYCGRTFECRHEDWFPIQPCSECWQRYHESPDAEQNRQEWTLSLMPGR